MTRIEDKSEEDLILERNVLHLRLLRIEKELARKDENKGETGLRDKNKSETGLPDKNEVRILIGNKVRFTPSTKNSRFAGKEYARVIPTGHNGKRVRLSLLSDQSITTDHIPTNIEIVREF